MQRAVAILSVAFSCAFSWAGSAEASPAAVSVGELKIQAWDARRDVYFKKVQVWRRGCDLTYKLTYSRAKSHPIRLRLLLTLDAGPASTPTGWISSAASGDQTAQGSISTPGCWATKARTLERVGTQVEGATPRRPPPGGREYLGKVSFNRWGSSGDVYYRHIQIWRKGCAVQYQFLYKRANTVRRRLKLRLALDTGVLVTGWVRSHKPGWREIVGSADTPGCWAGRAKTIKSAGFESERY